MNKRYFRFYRSIMAMVRRPHGLAYIKQFNAFVRREWEIYGRG